MLDALEEELMYVSEDIYVLEDLIRLINEPFPTDPLAKRLKYSMESITAITRLLIELKKTEKEMIKLLNEAVND
jgi:hypothetical protein